MNRSILFALVLMAGVAGQASAVTILSTDFDGRIVAGSTASNLTWITNGVADPGNLTAATNPDGLFDTADAQNRFAVDRNLHNEGSWSVDISLAVGAAGIDLTTVNLDAFIFNNAGDLQGDGRHLSMTAELLDAGLTGIDSDTVADIFTHNEPGLTQPKAVTFDLSGNTLAANTTYTLRLIAFGQGPGNNSGLDNLVVNGDILAAPVPEPVSAGLALMGVAGLALRRRRS